jgi:hypothetical protein
VVLKEEDPAILKSFLKYLYTDQVRLDENNADKLLAFADKYNVQKPKRTCGQFLAEHIGITTS